MDTTTATTLLALTATGWGATLTYACRQHQAAHTDSLTGLPNRDTLPVLVRRACRHRTGAAGLIMLDVDRFKSINDTHGHAVGNRVLHAIAARLVTAAGPGEHAIRLHGDEFALWLGVLPASTASHRRAVHRAAAVRIALADPIDVDGLRLTVTVSTGAAVLPVAGLTVAALLAAADNALYQAKYATYQATGAHLPTPEHAASTPRQRNEHPEVA